MRKILVSLAIVLATAISAWGLDSDEQNQLSFSARYEVPGAKPEHLRVWVRNWFQLENEFVNLFNSTCESTGAGDNVFSFHFNDCQLKQKKYDIAATVYIFCAEGYYVIEMTSIHGHALNENIMGGRRLTMTADGTEINRFMFPNFYRRSYWKIRQSIEEDFFPRLCASIHRSMLEHAELEL